MKISQFTVYTGKMCFIKEIPEVFPYITVCLYTYIGENNTNSMCLYVTGFAKELFHTHPF